MRSFERFEGLLAVTATTIRLVGADVEDRADRFALHVTRFDQRASGEPYLSHPLEVAHILADILLRLFRGAADMRSKNNIRNIL